MSQYVTTGVIAFGIKGGNKLKLEICVFDRDGSLIGQGTADSEIHVLTAQDTGGFKKLYDFILEPARKLIAALGSPEA